MTGAAGLLGQDVVRTLNEVGEDVLPFDRSALDIVDGEAVTAAVSEAAAAFIVNCAAWTDVDAAEADEEAALRVNGEGVRNLVTACQRTGGRLVHISTDYVFQGNARAPYSEDATTRPLNAYGRTKLAGERAVLDHLPDRGYVVRTAWLYGARGSNFATTMLRLERERDTIEVVDDQLGQPTWSVDVARQVVALALSSAAPGVYHATSSGETSWHGFATEIFRGIGADPERVRRTDSSAFHRPASRPEYSVLGHARWSVAGIPPIRHWQDGLAAALPELVDAGGRTRR